VVVDGQLRLTPGAKYEAREPRSAGADKGGKGAPKGDGAKGDLSKGDPSKGGPPAKSVAMPIEAKKGEAK
jgi:hypothetical protein